VDFVDFVDSADFVSILGLAFVLLLVDTTCLAEDFFLGCLKVFVRVIVEKIVLMTSNWRTLISVTSMISYTLSVLSMISTTLWCLCFGMHFSRLLCFKSSNENPRGLNLQLHSVQNFREPDTVCCHNGCPPQRLRPHATQQGLIKARNVKVHTF